VDLWPDGKVIALRRMLDTAANIAAADASSDPVPESWSHCQDELKAEAGVHQARRRADPHASTA
jgi:hypothetical protein